MNVQKNAEKIQVLKFGGTSVKDIDTIKLCCEKVIEHIKQGPIIVVVSAKAGMTDSLLREVERTQLDGISLNKHESDMIVTTGENMSAGLFSGILRSYGLNSEPLCAWQLPIILHQNEISEIRLDNLNTLLANRIVPVITGFQGVENNRIASLSRGGSDITAVWLARSLNCDCYIYSDLPGIYRISPTLLPPEQNQVIQTINYGDAYKLAINGAKIIHPDAVKAALAGNINVLIKSTFNNSNMTLITNTNNREWGIAYINNSKSIYILHNNKIDFSVFDQFEIIYKKDTELAIKFCESSQEMLRNVFGLLLS